jgi:hypothetical protein
MIFGSNKKSEFIKVWKSLKTKFPNNEGYDYSLLGICNDGFDTIKIHHTSKTYKTPRKKYENILGCFNEKVNNKFDPEIMNPFVLDKWIVLGGGVLSNKNKFKGVYVSGQLFSSFISELLYSYSELNNFKNNEVSLIKECFSLIEGNYAICLHNYISKNTYIVKCNLDIYANIYENTFSPIKFRDSEELRDGEIYLLTKEGITSVDIFNCEIC